MSHTQHGFAPYNFDLNGLDVDPSYFDDAYFDPVLPELRPFQVEYFQHNTQDVVPFSRVFSAPPAPTPAAPVRPSPMDWFECTLRKVARQGSCRSAPFIRRPSKLRYVVCSSSLPDTATPAPTTPAVATISIPPTTFQYSPLFTHQKPLFGLSPHEAANLSLLSPET